MSKKEDKTTMGLQKIVIIVGLVGSILTTVISMGKELSGVAKDWLVSDNKVEIEKLHVEIDELNAKLDERDLKQQKLIASINKELVSIRTEMNDNYILSLSHKLASKTRSTKTEDVVPIEATKSIPPTQQTTSASPYMLENKSKLNWGWITGAIGLLGWIIFGLWYFIHKKKNI